MTLDKFVLSLEQPIVIKTLLVKNDTLTDQLVEKIEKPKLNLKLPLETDM